MIYGEHNVTDSSHVIVYATNGQPGMIMSKLMGIKVGSSMGCRADLTRAEVERLRDLCDEALA